MNFNKFRSRKNFKTDMLIRHRIIVHFDITPGATKSDFLLREKRICKNKITVRIQAQN